MRFSEIEKDRFKKGLRQGKLYDVVVASKLGRYKEASDLSLEDAKYKLNDLVGEFQSDVFPDDSRAYVEWQKDGMGAKSVIPAYREGDPDNEIFYYIVPVGDRA